MRYQNVRAAKFLDRPNRFIAHVELDGAVETVHVKNTGRCRELLIPGCTVYLEKGTNPNRKTAYDLIAVEKGETLINMDAQAPNKVFAEWAAAGGFLPDVTAIRPEYVYGASRLDFCLETPGGLHLVEVKGVTLETDGKALFPDAPTERGVRHIRELQRAAESGLDAALFFVVQIRDIQSVAPNDATHPAFGQALREAVAHGVRVLAYDCDVTPDSLTIRREVPVVQTAPMAISPSAEAKAVSARVVSAVNTAAFTAFFIKSFIETLPFLRISRDGLICLPAPVPAR